MRGVQRSPGEVVVVVVEADREQLDVSFILSALLDEFSAIEEYQTLRDILPLRLTGLLHCKCVLLYQSIDETLQLISGNLAEQPGWSATLLAVAHINPIDVRGELPEAVAWRTHQAVVSAQDGLERALVCAPLIYRQRVTGVLSVLRGLPNPSNTYLHALSWAPLEVSLVAAVAKAVALLLENTRLLTRERERIHELSLLNSITSQVNCSLYDGARVQHILLQRAREISGADLCEFLTPTTATSALAENPPTFYAALLQHWRDCGNPASLVLERAGQARRDDPMRYLAAHVKTCFAVPLLGGGEPGAMPVSVPQHGTTERGVRFLGVLVGTYSTPWKLRRGVLALLEVLANQASAVLENIVLMAEVIEARNEARHLLRQVLDDQQLKELILESIPSGLLTVDMQGEITTFNRAAETILGYHPLEVIGQPVHKILALRGLERVSQGTQPQREMLLASGQQGQQVALDLTLMPLFGEGGRQAGVLATFADVTSVHRLEEEKRRLAHLASLGTMSANVAHEVRNPLASIKTSMQMVLADLENEDALHHTEDIRVHITVVLKEVERLNSIVRDLLLFARPRPLHLVEYDPLAICEHILHVLQPQCSAQGIRAHLLRQDVPSVQVDLAQMEQVLMNLCLNAVQAMPEGGVLSISCQVVSSSVAAGRPRIERQPPVTPLLEYVRHMLADDEPVAVQTQATHPFGTREPRSWLEISISDTGSGIAQESLEQIFQPFYTTKAHGIGLGLPITRQLVENHRGSLLVESRLGYGTTISIRLPLMSR